jgi:hypothetical protein
MRMTGGSVASIGVSFSACSAADRGSFVTGTELVVDGGMSRL